MVSGYRNGCNIPSMKYLFLLTYLHLCISVEALVSGVATGYPKIRSNKHVLIIIKDKFVNYKLLRFQ